MWGDAALMRAGAKGGRDTFIFSGEFGDTRIHDFRHGQDRLQVNIDSLLGRPAQVSWERAGSDTVVTVSGPVSEGTFRLVDYKGSLSTSDFYFV